MTGEQHPSQQPNNLPVLRVDAERLPVDARGSTENLEAMFALEAAAEPDVQPAQEAGRHRAPEEGRHRAPEDGPQRIDSRLYGIYKDVALEATRPEPTGAETGRHRAPESETSQRLLVRAATRVSTVLESFAGKMSGKRTTKEFAGDQVERGREAVRKAGSAIVAGAQEVGKDLSVKYNYTKEAGKNGMTRVREAFKARAASARARKDELTASIRSRSAKVAESVRGGAEKTGRAAKAAGEIVMLSGMVVADAGVRGTKAAGRSVRNAAGAGANQVKRTWNDVRAEAADLRYENKKAKAQKAASKAVRAGEKAQALAKKAGQ